MAARTQVPERRRSSESERSSERDRLWGLTQPVPSAPVANQPTEDAAESSVVPADPVDGWVPARAADQHEGAPDVAALDPGRGARQPAGDDLDLDRDPAGRDAADVDARRSSALATASKAYADAHGHPLTHPGGGERRPSGQPRRWAVPMRLALTAALAMGLVGGAVALRSASVATAGVAPVELPPVGASLSSLGSGQGD